MNFAIFSDKLGQPVIAEKIKKESSCHFLEGYTYSGKVSSTNKMLALSKFKKLNPNNHKAQKFQILKQVSDDQDPVKVIYCDFNGVLDVHEKTMSCNRSSTLGMLSETVNIKNLYLLLKLAIDTQSQVVLTSMWRNYGVNFLNIFRFLKNCGIPEYNEYYIEHKNALPDIGMDITENSGPRTNEIERHARENNVTHCVVFEDDHFIDSRLNPIRTNYRVGLLQEHFDEAYKLLS
ncbi:HAD domain-containing protein [Psychromonas sp. SP041]|uniref:HAD domain-containing protein n=1 Tax=Psychromonas sp. SP041 TaxID=1365007 RepID=UPI0004036986|nr:HAD domain-containing protein [Psychromonas sp. SP041]